MPRPATGTIIERSGADGRVTRTLRFHARGERRRVPLGPVSRNEAERQLAYVLADVARGTWEPAEPVEARPEIPTFHEFAEEWWIGQELQLAESTKADYRWRLEKHLLGYFGQIRLDAIRYDTIESYKTAKLAEDKPLSARSINMTLTLLGAILESAHRRELVKSNVARGVRVRERKPQRSYLDNAAQIEGLLDAARALDREAPKDKRHFERHAMLATLAFAGLRVGELLSLRWRDVDLAGGWLTVGEAKTDAGVRKVKLRGALRDALSDLRARVGHREGYVFPTSAGNRLSPENFRGRVFAGAIKRADQNLAEAKLAPLPEKLTPHSLRRTFASVLYALGEPPPVVMAEMGHTEEGLALRIYAQVMRRDESEKAALRALVDGEKIAEPRAQPSRAATADSDRPSVDAPS